MIKIYNHKIQLKKSSSENTFVKVRALKMLVKSIPCRQFYQRFTHEFFVQNFDAKKSQSQNKAL